jgi:hypothetical protein
MTTTTGKMFFFVILLFNYTLGNSQIRFEKDAISSIKIQSKYQEDSTKISTIKTELIKDSLLNIIFILPVEEQKNYYKYGSGIEEVKKLIDSNLINKNVVFIQPEFIRVPWYGNHPSNLQVGQENYLIEIIEGISAQFKNYTNKIYLLGFSKSGWGSMSILFNYPNLVDGIFIWDTPLSLNYNTTWTMGDVFGDEKYFEDFYQLQNRLLDNHDAIKYKTIVIGGYDLFRQQSLDFIEQMGVYGVGYIHDENLKYKHEWNKEWIYKLLQYKQGITKNKLH